MAIKEINEKTTKRGGIREGAGRKKSLPEGAKPSSFILTDAEKTADQVITETENKSVEEVDELKVEEKAKEVKHKKIKGQNLADFLF